MIQGGALSHDIIGRYDVEYEAQYEAQNRGNYAFQ